LFTAVEVENVLSCFRTTPSLNLELIHQTLMQTEKKLKTSFKQEMVKFRQWQLNVTGTDQVQSFQPITSSEVSSSNVVNNNSNNMEWQRKMETRFNSIQDQVSGLRGDLQELLRN
jgi:hypothetical protein